MYSVSFKAWKFYSPSLILNTLKNIFYVVSWHSYKYSAHNYIRFILHKTDLVSGFTVTGLRSNIEVFS